MKDIRQISFNKNEMTLEEKRKEILLLVKELGVCTRCRIYEAAEGKMSCNKCLKNSRDWHEK